jgi:hypothetical protein
MAIGADSWFQADVAQLVEHSLGKGEVTSSILVIGSRDLEVVEDLKGHGFSRAV